MTTVLLRDAAPVVGRAPELPPTAKNRTPPRRQLLTTRHRDQTSTQPSLRFSPTAWAKLLYLRDRGDTEVGGFGIAARQDVLRVEDFRTVQQMTSPASVRFDDAAVADFFDEQIDAGRHPEQVGRIWIHTHPGDSAQPSSVDEETFARVFGTSDWAVMFILAQGGQTYARLGYHVGPGGSLLLPVCVDFTKPFSAATPDEWEQEYQQHVHPESWDVFAAAWDDPFLEFLSEPDHQSDQRLAAADPFEDFSLWTL